MLSIRMRAELTEKPLPPRTETPRQTPLDRDPQTENPPGQRPPWTETPLDGDPPDRDLWTETPSPVERQTPVKT